MWWLLAAGCADRMGAPGDEGDAERVVAGTWTQSTTPTSERSPTFDAALLGDEIHAMTTLGYRVYARSGSSWTEIDRPWTPTQDYPGEMWVFEGFLAGTFDAAGQPCVAYAAHVANGVDQDLTLDCGAYSVPSLDWYASWAHSVVFAAEGPHMSWDDQYRSPDNGRRALGTFNDLTVADDTVWGAWLHDDSWLVLSDLTNGDWMSCSSLPCPGDAVLSTSATGELAIATSASGHVAVAAVTSGPPGPTSQPFVLTLWEDGGPGVELVRWTQYYPDTSNPFIAVDVAYHGDVPYVAFSHEDAVEVVAVDGDTIVREVAMPALALPWNGAFPSYRSGFQLQVLATGAPRILTTDYWHDGIRVIERSAPMVEPEPEPEIPEVLGLADLVAGDIVVTEVLANPAAADDAVGEWIEVHVPGELAVDLDGLIVEDEGGRQGVVTGSLVVAPGGYVVLGRSDAARFAPAEVAPDGFYGDDPALNNSGGDRVVLVGPAGVLDQTARYTRGVSGAAWQLSGDTTSAVDNDDASQWCRAAEAGPGGDLGTPGAPNGGC